MSGQIKSSPKCPKCEGYNTVKSLAAAGYSCCTCGARFDPGSFVADMDMLTVPMHEWNNLHKLAAKAVQLERDLDLARGECGALRVSRDEQVGEWKKKAESGTHDVQLLRKANMDLSSRCHHLERELAKAGSRIAHLERPDWRKDERISEYAKANVVLEDKLHETTNELADARRERDEIRSDRDHLRARLGEAQREQLDARLEFVHGGTPVGWAAPRGFGPITIERSPDDKRERDALLARLAEQSGLTETARRDAVLWLLALARKLESLGLGGEAKPEPPKPEAQAKPPKKAKRYRAIPQLHKYAAPAPGARCNELVATGAVRIVRDKRNAPQRMVVCTCESCGTSGVLVRIDQFYKQVIQRCRACSNTIRGLALAEGLARAREAGKPVPEPQADGPETDRGCCNYHRGGGRTSFPCEGTET